MFRLPFAAGRVFSISMLDTLLYQVGCQTSGAELWFLMDGVLHKPVLSTDYVRNFLDVSQINSHHQIA